MCGTYDNNVFNELFKNRAVCFLSVFKCASLLKMTHYSTKTCWGLYKGDSVLCFIICAQVGYQYISCFFVNVFPDEFQDTL